MTIVHQRTVARSLPNAAVGGGTISLCGSNAVNHWSLNEPGNFVTCTASATIPTSGPLMNAAVGGTASFGYVDITNNSYLPIQAGTFVVGPSGCVTLTGGSLPNAPHWTSVAYLFNATLSSSEPVISQSELFDDYRELGEAFGQIAELDEDDDSWIEVPVLNIARNVAVELMTGAFPVPQIFNHGPKSLVFNWVNGRDNLYLTVSERNVSILVSTPQKIKKRVEYSVGEFLKHEHIVPLLHLAYSEQQTTITVSGTSE